MVVVRSLWVDACRPHGAVVDTKCLEGMLVRCRVSGKTPSTALCVNRVVGLWGWWFVFPSGRWLPAGHGVVGWVSGGVV